MYRHFKLRIETGFVAKMSGKIKDDKPSTSSIVGCCQSSTTTPENSIVDYIGDEIEISNNNNLFHASNATKSAENVALDAFTKKRTSIEFTFPKRPKVDIEFQTVKYTVKRFSFKQKRFGEYFIISTTIYRPVIAA